MTKQQRGAREGASLSPTMTNEGQPAQPQPPRGADAPGGHYMQGLRVLGKRVERHLNEE